MATEKGYIGNTNKHLIQLGGRSGVQSRFSERFTRNVPEVPTPYESTFLNDWIRSGVSASITEDSGSILYAMVDEGSGDWGNANIAIPKVALKVKNIGNATASYEFSYDPSRNTDWTYFIQPKEWGKKYTGQGGAYLAYQTYRYAFYKPISSICKLYEAGTLKWSDAGTTSNDKFGLMFYGGIVHVIKNGVVVYTSTTDRLDSFDDDYMLIVHAMNGYGAVSTPTGGEYPWIWNTKVSGETKPWSFEKEFETQFKNLKPAHASHIDYAGTGVNYFITGSNDDNLPTWNSYLGNYFIGTHSAASWNGGFTFGPEPGVTASFTGSGTGGAMSFRFPSFIKDAATQVGALMFGWDFGTFDPSATNNYNQLEPGFYYTGKFSGLYYKGANSSAFAKNSTWTMASGSTSMVIMTGSIWSGTEYSGEEGNFSYLLTKFEDESGQPSMPWGWSNDYMIYGAYPSEEPGNSADSCIAFSAGRHYLVNLQIATDI